MTKSSSRLMDLLSKLLGVTSASERFGIRMDELNVWQLSNPNSVDKFLLEIGSILPPGSILCIEATDLALNVKKFLIKNQVSNITKVQLHVGWPKPDVFHIPADLGRLNKLASLSDSCAIPELMDHLYIYKESKILVFYYHAFMDGDLYISKELEYDDVIAFAKSLNLSIEDPARVFFAFFQEKGYLKREVMTRVKSLKNTGIEDCDFEKKLLADLEIDWDEYKKRVLKS